MTEERLDRTKSFGVVYGDPNVGYEQGGRYFRHDGAIYIGTQRELTGQGVNSAPATASKATTTLTPKFRRANEPESASDN